MGRLPESSALSDQDLLILYAHIVEELRVRKIVRTSNNPVADYAEKVAVECLNLKQAGKEERGYDAMDSDGQRYQIKGRRLTKHNASRQLGVIRNLDEKLFDYLIAVIFNEEFAVQEIWKIPYEFVRGNSRWSKQQYGYIFHARVEMLHLGEGVERIL